MINPFIFIILPIRNESEYIEKVMLSILAQDYPADQMKVMIVDGMSTDNTRKIINEFSLKHPHLKIQILDNPGKIVPVGMNIALQKAKKGDVIIRVDGHCIIAPDYVRKCVEHIQNDNVDGVGGPMEAIGETQMAKAIAIGMSSPFGVGDSAFRTTSGISMLVDTVPFPAYSRQIIERAGYYDEELIRNQDDEYNYRIRGLDGKILLADDVRSTYFSRTSLKSLWRQYYQYGYWKVRVLQKHLPQMSSRQFVPPAFVLSLLFSTLLALLSVFYFSSSSLGFLSMIIPLSYVTLNFGASLWIASKHGWRTLQLLPIVFVILHLSYGLGFLVGLVKFADRWGDKKGSVPVYFSEQVVNSFEEA
jgi:succinoglycan biosynthesis protein ExoA